MINTLQTVSWWQVATLVLAATSLYLFLSRHKDRKRLRRLSEELGTLSHDPVTRLPFETLARKQIVRAMRRASNDWKAPVYITIIFTDAKGLRKVNGECGQSGGDMYLRAHAEHLQELVRAPDVVFRRGGGSRADELIAVLVVPAAAYDAVHARRLPFILGELGQKSITLVMKGGLSDVYPMQPHIGVAERIFPPPARRMDAFDEALIALDAALDAADKDMEKKSKA